MTITLTNYQTTLPAALFPKAGKCSVRECDETSKGFFEAYVDEGEESYDVALRLSPKKEVTEYRCDCGSAEAFCRHKTALLMHLAGKTKKPAAAKAVKGKAKSKQSQTDALLEAADTDQLKAWVKELLDKNKDLALAFVQRFGEQKTAYTKAEAEALTMEAAKTVVKNRTKVEQSELKKIVELWGNVHQPVVEGYTANVTNEEAFLAFHAMLNACLAFAQKVGATGVKISNYVEGLLNQTVELITPLFSDEAFETAIAFYRQHLVADKYLIRMHYAKHLQKILSLSTPERLAAGAEKLVEQYATIHPDRLINGNAYTKLLFDFLDRNGLLQKYLSRFQPITWDNSFNGQLIEKLIDQGALEKAEAFAQKQMAGNYREEYNLPYLILLKKIYALQKNEGKLAGVMAQLLPYSFNFDDYLFISERMPEDEEKKKWRTMLITKARNASSYGQPAADDFYFRLLAHEQNYKKMLTSINSYTPYRLLLDYFEPMALTDKNALLKAFIVKGGQDKWSYLDDEEEEENEEQYFPALLDKLVKTYGKPTLLLAIKQAETSRYYYQPGRFITFLKKALSKD